MRLIISLSLVCALVAADENKTKPSTLAPSIPYLDVWAFLHSKDTDKPKVLYIPKPPADEDAAAKETPSWLTSAAMAFTSSEFGKGRSYTARFAIIPEKDSQRVAKRFGLEPSALPALLGCRVDAGTARKYDDGDADSATAKVKSVKAFVNELIAGESREDDLSLPSFPEPTRPRKQASVSLEEFTHESLPINCYGVKARPLCVLAILDQPAGKGCPTNVEALARKFKNDKNIGFGCVGAAKQTEFLQGFGIEEMPALVAVKGGKRARFARLEGSMEEPPQAMAAFVDNVLGGQAKFTKASADGLPELEPPYLLGEEEEKDEV